jgi:hypothetical protein
MFAELNFEETGNLHGAYSATVREKVVLEICRGLFQKAADHLLLHPAEQINILPFIVEENTVKFRSMVKYQPSTPA